MNMQGKVWMQIKQAEKGWSVLMDGRFLWWAPTEGEARAFRSAVVNVVRSLSEQGAPMPGLVQRLADKYRGSQPVAEWLLEAATAHALRQDGAELSAEGRRGCRSVARDLLN